MCKSILPALVLQMMFLCQLMLKFCTWGILDIKIPNKLKDRRDLIPFLGIKTCLVLFFFLLEDSTSGFFNHCACDWSFKKWSASLPFKKYKLCIDILLLWFHSLLCVFICWIGTWSSYCQFFLIMPPPCMLFGSGHAMPYPLHVR